MKKLACHLPALVFACLLVPSSGAKPHAAQNLAGMEGSDCCPTTGCCCGLWSRPRLTGDWLGHRSSMAERGIVLDADVTQFYQGVAGGGLEPNFLYGGHGDYVLKFDFDKLSGQEGLFLQLRAEHRFGQAINTEDGSCRCFQPD